MRSRAITQTVQRPKASLLVEEFRCQSHSLSNAIGTNASHCLWRMRALGHGAEDSEITNTQVGPESHTLTVEVTTDSGVGGVKGAVMGTQVNIKANGSQLFPNHCPKAKLNDDWMRDWKFRCSYPGVGLVRPGEAWVPGTVPTDVPCQVGDAAHFVQTRMLGDGKLKTMHEVQLGSQRCPAVLTKQLPNGCFDLTAFRQDDYGVFHGMEIPGMYKSSIFLTASGDRLDLPELTVSLDVPRCSPQDASIYIAGESSVNHLGRVSPPVKCHPRRIEVNVPRPVIPDAKQRLQHSMLGIIQQEESVHVNAGASVLEHFLSGEVRRGDMTTSRFQKDWVLQLGPFARHSIRLVKKSHVNPVMTLYVDNEILVECTSADLGGDPNVFRCRFCFVGERFMDFSIFEETKDGIPLDDKCVVTKPYQYHHEVEVLYSHKAIDNLADAVLKVDGHTFEALPSMVAERYGGQELKITRTALEAQFPINIPRKVAPQDTRGVAHQIAQNMVKQAGGWGAITENASRNLAVASTNFSKSVEDVGRNLSMLGLSAWEKMFLERGADTHPQSTLPPASRPHLLSVDSEGCMAQQEGCQAQMIRVTPRRRVGFGGA